MVKMYCELMEPATVATGAYLAHEAGMLAGVPGDRIGQWARWGHIRASVSAAEPHVYAFSDVAEALADALPLHAVLLSHDRHGDNLDDAGRALLPAADVVVTTAAGAGRLGG